MTNGKKDSNRLLTVTFVSVTVMLAIRLICSFLPEPRLWGGNFAAYIDGMAFLYPLLFLMTLYLFIQRKKHFQSAVSATDDNQRLYSPGWIVPIMIIVLAGLGFYLLKVNSHFLGDGYMMISSPHMSIKYREYGEVVIHLWFMKTFGSMTSESVRLIYQMISFASGAILVTVLTYYTRQITANRFSYYSFIALNLLTANMILYFGYVENYSIVAMVLTVFMISSIASLRNNKKSAIPVITYSIALFLHTISLVFLPALVVYVFLTFFGGSIRDFVVRHTKILLSLMSIGFIAVYSGVRLWAPLFWKMAFLPPLGDRFTLDNYYLLSPSHIVDYLNLLVMIVPVSLVVGVVILFARQKPKTDNSDSVKLFLWVATIFGLLAAFVIEPKMGMARDWDLMSIMLIGAGISGIYIWFDRFQCVRWFKPASVMLCLLSLSVFIPWLTLHNSVEGLYSFSMDALERDPKHSRSAFYTMGALADQMGNQPEANRLRRYCQRNFPERQLDREGGALYHRGDYARAEAVFKRGLKENPAWFALYMDLGMTLVKLGKYAEALENLKIADGLNPSNPVIYNFLGQAHMGMSNTDMALHFWHKCIAGDHTIPEPYISLGQYYLQKEKPDSALYYFRQLSDESYPAEVFYLRGLLRLHRGDTASAVKELERYLQIGKDQKLKDEINNFKKELVNQKQALPV
ncbi:MAG: tetratricopeptide repeat protein [FCB group bacterium]|nr:tetratricopeptide repeat protein [FCB group bacterium]